MMDLAYIGIAVAFFAVSYLLIRLFGLLSGNPE